MAYYPCGCMLNDVIVDAKNLILLRIVKMHMYSKVYILRKSKSFKTPIVHLVLLIPHYIFILTQHPPVHFDSM